MREFSIESNGRIGMTALYLNGEQISGVHELLIQIDEDGTFNSVISYKGTDKQIRTKNLFSDYLDNLRVIEPAFSEEEARSLQLLTVESNGDIEETVLYLNDEPLEGVVGIFLHVKKEETESSLSSLFSSNKKVLEGAVFRAEITYRNEDDSLETENVFL
jgi:hypothetical protein